MKLSYYTVNNGCHDFMFIVNHVLIIRNSAYYIVLNNLHTLLQREDTVSIKGSIMMTHY